MPSNGRAPFLLAASLPLMLWAQPALAQQTTYTAEDFANAAPLTALDMVTRVPGFSIIEADEDVRGYSGAQGNVLIDNALPASKRESIHDLLRRIPSRAVERIELIRGADANSTHALVVNVVRRAGAHAETALEIGTEYATDGTWGPRALLEYGRRSGAHITQFAVNAQRESDEDSGRGGVATHDAGGALTSDEITDTQRIIDTADLSLSHRRPLAGGFIALTTALRAENDAQDQDIIARDGSGGEFIREQETYREFEAGARFTRPLTERTTLELIASQQFGWREADENVTDGAEIAAFSENTSTGETIARIELSHDTTRSIVFNASLDGAFNFLESSAALSENNAPTPLPGTDVRIEETRGEAAFGARWRAARGLTLQAALRVETSRISQTGDSPLERSFTFAKPRLSVNWDIDPRNELRFSVSREVDQLDFSDFVAATSFATGAVTAGNSELAPAQTWRTMLAWERQFWTDGALTIRLTHDSIEDAADHVRIEANGEEFDAPGNIGAGVRDTLAVELAASLGAIGLANFRLTAQALWRRSEVTDPTTGVRRPISDEPVREGEIELTHVLARRGLNWGVSYEIAQKETHWRYDDIATEREAASWTVFAEQRLNERWRLRLEASDLGGRGIADSRQRYDGSRDSFPLSEIEHRTHRAPGRVMFILRRNTGG